MEEKNQTMSDGLHSTSNTLFKAERQEGESYSAYKTRQKLRKAMVDVTLKGNLFWDSRAKGTYINVEKKKNAKSK